MNARGGVPRAGLLFDLDGTLAQTEHLHHAAFNALLADYGRSIDHATFLRYVSGRSNDEITAYLFPDKAGDERERLAQDKERWFRELATAGVEATPGALKLIAWARGRGLATGLVTNAPRENADLMVALLGMGECFDLLVTADEAPRGKPHPDPYLMAMRELALDPARTLVVEDSATGIAAARAANLDVVALATPETAASIAQSGAVLSVADMNDARLQALIEAKLLA